MSWFLFKRPLFGRRDPLAETEEQRGRQAVFSLKLVLSEWGRNAFDLDDTDAAETRTQCDAWCRHIDGAVPSPAREGRDVHPTDWEGLGKFAGTHRRLEMDYVVTHLRELRRGLWHMVQVLSRNLLADRKADDRVRGQLRELRQSVDSRSTEDLRKAVNLAVEIIGQTLAERESRFHEQVAGMGEELKEVRVELEDARRELQIDPLTRVFNRAAVEEHLSRLTAFWQLAGRPCAVLIVDVDHFKELNDGHGHNTGDFVLRALADCCVRRFPRRSDLVARYGGGAFAVLIEEGETAEAARQAEQLLRAVRDLRFESEGTEIRITASVGVVTLRQGESPDSLLHRAELALAAAKRNGRDRVATEDTATFRAA